MKGAVDELRGAPHSDRRKSLAAGSRLERTRAEQVGRRVQASFDLVQKPLEREGLAPKSLPS